MFRHDPYEEGLWPLPEIVVSRSASLGTRRRGSRLAAVQALYQIELTDQSVEDVINDLRERRSAGAIEVEEPVTPESVDEPFFEEIVTSVASEFERYDALLEEALDRRKIARTEIILRLILRAAAYEIIDRPDIDPPLSINEYVAISQAFFSETQPTFVNGVLDRLAKEAHSDGQG